MLTQLKQGAHYSLFVATKDQKPELNRCFGRPFAAPPLVGCDDPPSSMFAVYSPFRCLLNGARMHYSLAVCTVQVSSWNYGCNIPITIHVHGLCSMNTFIDYATLEVRHCSNV